MAASKWKNKSLREADTAPGVLGSLDAFAQQYAAVGADNRLRVWDTQSGKMTKQFTPPNHLNVRYSCLRWAPVPVAPSSSRGRKSRNTATGAQSANIVALGSEKGAIVLWNIQTGQVEAELAGGDGHTSRVHDIVFSSASVLFSCDADGYVIEWNCGKVHTKWQAHKEPTYCLALNADSTRLLTASSSIQLWDLSSKKAIRSFTGHSSPVHSLCFTNAQGTHCLSSAAADRYVNLWACEGSAKSHSTTQVFVAPSELNYLRTNLALTDAQALHFVGLSVGGKAMSVWSTSLEEDAQPNGRRSVPSKRQRRTPSSASAASAAAPDAGERRVDVDCSVLSAKQQRCILYAGFCSEHQLMVVRGAPLRPQFEALTYWDAEAGEMVDELSLGSSSHDEMDESNETTADAVAGSARSNQEDIQVLDAVASSSVKKPRSSVGTSGAMPVAAADVTSSAADRSAETLYERLQSLQVNEEADAPKKLDLPKAGSIHSVLIQALNTKDQERIDSCLAVTDAHIISETVDRLPTSFVLPFLTVVVDKFRAKPNRGPVLACWIRQILIRHTAYLMTVPHLSSSLSGLYQSIDQRLGSFKKLMQLSGRLDLIMSQINIKNQRLGAAIETSSALSMVEEDDISDSDDNSDESDSDMEEATIQAVGDNSSSGEEESDDDEVESSEDDADL
eukprot:CAMPEP_0174240642 /NCGR_PEP_ID=MMETSP0417-20130205/19799_1 /TAXON_ID=242541 /ORGANISM="Mayorella sp, Strain BSH-02190019" /LENGTH=675 /DNA_ID=CAMNT_0015319763 /DNA_START=65 /DNA_END=2089 /DNA_ORIENTATION=-